MKLLFKKNETGDVEVTMFKGTVDAPFSYIEMIKSLIAGESLDSDFDETITEDEKTQILEVLQDIEELAKDKEADKVTEEFTDDEF